MNRGFIVGVLVAAGLIGAGFWLFKGSGMGASNDERSIGKGKKGAQVEQKMLTFTIDGRSSQGAKQWHMEGNSAEIIGENIHLSDLKAVAYGDVTVRLTSDKGIYRKDKGVVELMGNVIVKGDDGTLLKTESASWSQNSKDISTDDEVKIERPGMSARGKGGWANSDKKQAKLKKNVIVAMEPHTTVTCDGPLDVSYDDNKAVFYKNVEVIDMDGKMYSDRLTVNFDRNSKKLAEVVAEGHVKVKRGKSYTLSEKAIYKDSTKSAQLLGRPQVIIDTQELGDLDAFREAGIGSGNQKK